MKNSVYLIRNNHAIAEVDDKCDIKSGTAIEYSHLRCKENINANREYNLVILRMFKLIAV
jgi:hypothetical protein